MVPDRQKVRTDGRTEWMDRRTDDAKTISLRIRRGIIIILRDNCFCISFVLCKNENTIKPVLSGHLKIDQTRVLMEKGSLMKVKSIAECSLGAFWNTFDLH